LMEQESLCCGAQLSWRRRNGSHPIEWSNRCQGHGQRRIPFVVELN
jgi:hypothetical protein